MNQQASDIIYALKNRLGKSHSIWIILLSALFCSCGTRAPRLNYTELAQAAYRLEMDIDLKDNHQLYVESSKWIGVPYRQGGNTMKGTDCSGFTAQIYRKVYHVRLERSSESQRRKNCKRISKHKLEEGDLVFFHNGKNRKRATHVGIYLKQNRFVHASSSRGVTVSNLNEPYYLRCWMHGGRVKGL